MNQRRGLFGAIYNLLFTSQFTAMKIGIAGLIAAAYIGYKNHEVIGRFEENILKRNIKVERGFFPDVVGLSVESSINSSGYREVYLIHRQSGKRIAIMYDMLPKTDTMLEGLIERAERMKKEELKSTLDKIIRLEKILYERL